MNPRFAWLILIVPALVFGNLFWFRITRELRARGVDYPRWGGHITVLRRFHGLAAAEKDPSRRRQFRLWLASVYIAFALVTAWLALVWTSA